MKKTLIPKTCDTQAGDRMFNKPKNGFVTLVRNEAIADLDLPMPSAADRFRVNITTQFCSGDSIPFLREKTSAD